MILDVDDLVKNGLVKKKTYTEGIYAGLSVLKYSRKVFYDNLWHLDDRLLECRGTVVDENNKVVVLPFKKVFNLGENNTTVDNNLVVKAPRKINGFMAAATMTYKYGLIISTTGTLDSDFAAMARYWIEKGNYKILADGITHLFEICDPSDPHIVPEEAGAYLIGLRDVTSGRLYTESDCDMIARVLDYNRPVVDHCDFKTTLDNLKHCKHEGYMIRDAMSNEVLCKLKSPHYLATKAFLRMGKNRTNLMFNSPALFKEQIDEEFYEFHQFLLDNFTAGEYSALTQDQRRTLIEDYFNG